MIIPALLWPPLVLALLSAPAAAAADPAADLGIPWRGGRPPAPPLPWALRPTPSTRATTFDPRIDTMIAPVDSAAYFPWIRRLSGAEPVLVGGTSVTFTTRYTMSPQCDLAEQYVFERFAALGFDQVEYDPYLANGTPARNVIATQLGTETPQQIVIVCGHLDSTSPQASTNAPGANDNASGAAGVLTAAQGMRPWRFRNTIRFIAFTGEEQGELGSEHYAALVAASADSVLGVVNLDMVAWWSYRRQIDVEGSPFCAPIMTVMADACKHYTGVGTIFQFNPWGSDHVPFSERGMPSFLAIESDWASYPCYHRTCDTWDRNLGGFGAEVVKASIATAAYLAVLDVATAAPVVTSDRSLALDAWPCPFEGAVTIRVPAGRAGSRELTVHDLLGRRVRTLEPGARAGGAWETVWDGRADDGRALSGGVYFVRLREESGVSSVKVIRRR
ncbi:MAG: M28 family peptidase [bacterium]